MNATKILQDAPQIMLCSFLHCQTGNGDSDFKAEIVTIHGEISIEAKQVFIHMAGPVEEKGARSLYILSMVYMCNSVFITYYLETHLSVFLFRYKLALYNESFATGSIA